MMPLCSKCGAELEPPYRFCSKCGQPAVASPPYAAYGYPPPMVLPPRDNSHTIILLVVVVIVVLVAVPAALAAILYTMTSGGIVPGTSKPVIMMTLNTKTASSADLLVSGAQPAVSPSNLKVNFQVGTTYGTAVNFPTTAGVTISVVVGAGTYTVTWENPGGSGAVVAGDHFLVGYPGGSATPVPGTSLSFILIWTDGSTVSLVTWQA